MKIYSFIVFALLFMAASCSHESVIDETPEIANNSVEFTTRGPEADDVKIMFFKLQPDGRLLYEETFSPTWVDNKASKLVKMGSAYKFLFYKVSNLVTTTMSTPDSTTEIDDITFTSVADGSKGGDYVLPVEEIWLPNVWSISDIPQYTFAAGGSRVVSTQILRAVSGIEIYLRRGTKNSSGYYTERPFESGDITDIIESIKVDISGLGSAITVLGGTDDTAKHYFEMETSAGEIDQSTGFAYLNGSLVFPNNTRANSNIEIELIPVDPTSFPNRLTISTAGVFNRNRKVQINIWMTNSGTKSFDIEVTYGDMGEPIPGGEGIWN